MDREERDNRMNDDQSRGNSWMQRSDDDFFQPFGLGFRSQVFRDIDRWTDRMFRTFEDLEKQAEKGKFPSNAMFYGYSITIGPDGKPEVREFGNVRPRMNGGGQQQIELGAREPFVETIRDDKGNQLKVVAEMPGVRKEDIKAEVTPRSVLIRAERGERKYESIVSLSDEVDANSAKASYNNGILELLLKLKSPPADQQKQRGVTVKIE